MHLIDIIFRRIAEPLIGTGDHGNLRIFQDGLQGILAMSLNRNRKDQVRLIGRGVQRLENLPGQDLVLGPVLGCGFHLGHVFQSGKIVKAQIGVHFIAAVKCWRCVVDRMSRISGLLRS